MSETYIITAKTVDEAIAIANREYADADHEVAYDIIDMPKKGIFGIGARDAKIKITVSKVQKVELGSLVDDIRSMKTLTDRGGSRTPEKKTKPAVNVTAQNSAKPAQNGQKPTQNAQTQKSAKPAQPKQNQPKTEKSAEKPVQKKPVENAQPKSDKLAQQKQQNQQKPAQKPAEKPQNQNQQKPKAEAKPAEKPVENKPVEAKQKTAQPKVETKVEPKVEPKSETKVEAKTEPVQTTEAKAEKTYTSHLGNEVKRTRRPERKPQHTENIAASGVTVSSPVGLSDFSGTKNGGFGSGEYKSGRISNDIKKKPAQNNVKPVTDPAKANRDALKALTFDVDAHEKAQAEESAPAAPAVTKAERPARPAKPARQNKPQPKPVEKAQQKEEKYPESTLVKTEEQPAAADASAEKRLREGVTQAEMDFALDFANTLLENMKLDAKAVQAEANGDEYIINGEANVYPRINIIGADTGILIGHHGETLDAIQYLVNLSALRKSKQKDGDYVKIVVDIEGYREKREETLRTLARRMAARAVKYKRNVFLEPMNAYERRIIHSELQSFENVSTHSVGADKDRKIIITYEGPDKRERPDRRRAQAATAATDTAATDTADTAENPAQDSVKNEERRRPKKPVKLPIDKLTDLLESREDNFVTSDNCTAPAISEDAADAVSETEEAKQLVETEAEVGAIPEYVGEEAEAEADEAVEAEEADETEEASEEVTEKENDLADEEE